MRRERAAGLLACMIGITAVTQARGQGTGACAGINACMEARDIVSNVTDFRLSAGSNGLRILTATVRFTNKSTHPVILGYVNGSGIATDDQGNRYTVMNGPSVRAIGIINGSKVDPKFTLQPGESSDARFELGWRAASGRIFGTSYTFEFTVREINQASASQYRLGDEYALRFPSLSSDGNGLGAATPVVGAIAAAAPASGAVPAATPAAAASIQAANAASNACAGVTRCYDAGLFSAVVTSATGSKAGSSHVIDMTIRFRNPTSQPVILAYTQSSSAMIDNLGNRYYWGRAGTHDNSVQGIGMVAGSRADPQFVLRPGESRDAKFTVIRYNAGNNAIGTSFNYDVSIEQLQVLASQQIQVARQYAVHFDNLTAGGPVPSVTDAVNKLKGLFKKK